VAEVLADRSTAQGDGFGGVGGVGEVEHEPFTLGEEGPSRGGEDLAPDTGPLRSGRTGFR